MTPCSPVGLRSHDHTTNRNLFLGFSNKIRCNSGNGGGNWSTSEFGTGHARGRASTRTAQEWHLLPFRLYDAHVQPNRAKNSTNLASVTIPSASSMAPIFTHTLVRACLMTPSVCQQTGKLSHKHISQQLSTHTLFHAHRVTRGLAAYVLCNLPSDITAVVDGLLRLSSPPCATSNRN